MDEFITRDGCKLRYQLRGRGPLIALTPGGREAVARELARRLADSGSLTTQTALGSVQFFTSGDVAQAQAVMSHLWDAPLTVQALP